MSGKKKSVGWALGSLVAGVACMPAAAFIHTIAGLALATASVWMIFVAS